MTPLRATVRLQLHAGFTLRDAAAQVPYYAELGISHLYLSPIAAAVPGSRHGYDVIDPGRVNPELGGEAALAELAGRLREHGMGIVLDIVPNHVAAHHDNPWWWDVLRHGRGSRHAGWFDIDWHAPGCGGRLWLPVLDRPCAQALADGVLAPVRGAHGEWLLEHGGQRFPLRGEGQEPPFDAGTSGSRSSEALPRLLERQPYVLAWWRTGDDMVNYRRFFDITSLAALRMEVPEAFDAVHALPLRLVAEGIVDGLRIDHVDGLADPTAYLRRLRARVDRAARRRGDGERIALLVEKILAPGETLRTVWRCDGSTGYDFMDQVGALLHAPAGEAPLRALWRQYSRRSGDFAEEVRHARADLLEGSLHAEFMRAVRASGVVAGADPLAREFGPHLLAQALAALMTHYPVYRSYARRDGLDGTDAALFSTVAAAAREGADPRARAGIDAIGRWMHDTPELTAGRRAQRRRLRRRIEQLSAPLNAKAVEDTAFYRHGVLLSRNEVGAHPAHFALDVETFHAACAARARDFPRALLATATHDHKRGEDVRARLAVLSERPDWWAGRVREFEALAGALGGNLDAPSAGDRLILWQTVVGAWPLQLDPDDAAAMREFAARVAQWQRKAMREAKLETSWTVPREDYEAAGDGLVERALLAPEGAALRTALGQAAAGIAPAGALNGLVQATLRMTVPGTPDLYQGGEGWDLSLVDPDNRREVDYRARRHWLRDDADWSRLLGEWRDGRLKARVIARLLQLRRKDPALFASGDYRPLRCDGPEDRHVLAFLRGRGGHSVLVAVPRLAAAWLDGSDLPLPDPRHWGAAAFTLPVSGWRHVLDDRVFAPDGGRLPLAELFRTSPVAVLVAPR